MDYKEIKNEFEDKEKWVWKISWEEMIFEWDFSKGDEMIVAVWPYYDWGIPSLSDEPTGMLLPPNSDQWFPDVKRLRVNVTNIETGIFTLIEIYYVYTELGFPRIFQDYFGVINNTGALILDGTYPKPGTVDGKGVIYLGKVKENGIFRITFSMEPSDVMDQKIEDNKTLLWPHPISPPSIVRLYKGKESTITIYPYRSFILLPAGVITIALGGTFIFKSRKSSPKRHFKGRKSSLYVHALKADNARKLHHIR